MNYKLNFGFLQDFKANPAELYSIKERFEHTYILGKTGMGKSALMERMAEYDMNKGIAMIYIDPKGESTRKLYELAKDKSKVHYISIQSPIVINPLNKESYRLDNLIQEFIEILDRLITLTSSNPESTVLMREIINMAMRSIRNENDKNLGYLTKLLLYPDVRKELKYNLPATSDEYKYWDEFDSKGRSSNKVECAQRVASRLLEISNGEMKNFVIGKNELDITDIVQKGKVLLVDTSRMNRNSRIYLSNLIVYSVLSYCDFAPKKDKPLMVYVDEFQIVVSESFSDLLARSRGSQVGFTLAHQNFLQIPKTTLGSIFGNVGTSICFRCGDEEAKRFAPLFGVKAPDLFNLPKYQAWVRIGTENTLIETYPPKNPEISKDTTTIQLEIPLPEKSYSFLGDKWINF